MNTKMKGKKDKKLIRSISIYSKLNSISHIDHSLPGVVLPNDKNTFSSAANRTIQLTKEFRFPRPTAAWGNITHYFISDAPTGGSIWYCGKLAAPRNVESATSLIVKPDSIKLSLVSSSLAV